MKNLDERLSGESLLNALDAITELKNVNADIDEKTGIITVYHRTTKENLQKILKTKVMIAKENGLFFTTNQNSYNSISYGDHVLILRIPVEEIEIDDIFKDEVHIRIPLKGYKLNISKYL